MVERGGPDGEGDSPVPVGVDDPDAIEIVQGADVADPADLEEPDDLEERTEAVAWVRPQLSLLWHPVVVRSLIGIVVAFLIVLWPNRTDRILTRLVGLGLIVWSVRDLIEVGRILKAGIRTRAETRATAGRLAMAIRLLAIVAGLAVGAFLILGREQSTLALARLVGWLLIAVAVRELIGLRQGQPGERGWLLVKALAFASAGAVVVAFPEESFATMTVLFGLGWALVGVVAVTMSLDPSREGVASFRDVDDLLTDWLASRPKDADDRQALYAKILYEGTTLRRRVIRFASLMSFAAVIASMGVITDSTAVVIGAMLIAPLMTPLMGMAISLVMGWPARLTRSALIAAGGILLAITIGLFLGLTVPTIIDTASNSQIVARSSPTTLDLIVALAAGAAGAYGLSRPDVSDALPGVAIAISLVPPLTVVGISYSQGDWGSGNGALLLFATNMLAILVMGGVTFVLTGVTPISRVAENQHRVRTWAASVAVLAGIVLGALLLNGSQIASDAFERSTIERAVETWLADHAGYTVVEAGLDDDRVSVVIIGPSAGRPTADDLAAIAGEELGREVIADVRLVVEEREISGGG